MLTCFALLEITFAKYPFILKGLAGHKTAVKEAFRSDFQITEKLGVTRETGKSEQHFFSEDPDPEAIGKIQMRKWEIHHPVLRKKN